MKTQKMKFDNHNGDGQLVGRLEMPKEGETVAYALFAHCFTCSKNLNAVGHICRSLTQRGIAVLRFDFTGLGESEGDFADTNFSSNVADLVAAANHLEREFQAPQMLIGHSLGGAAVLQAAAQLASVKAVVTIGAPHDPKHVQHLLSDKRDEILAEGEAEVILAGRPFRIKKQFIDDLESGEFQENIRNLKKALLVCHAPFDDTVGIDNASQIFAVAKHPKSFISLDKADHLLSRSEDSKYVGHVIAAWSEPYVTA